jgi:nucleoid DNA-binding protein
MTGTKAETKATKPRRAAAAKPAAARRKAAAKPAAAAAAPSAPVKGGTLRKKDLIDRVVQVSGAKKKDTREIVEAVLTVLGDALAAGEMLALPPFGRARVNKQRDLDSGEMLTVKLRRAGPAKAGSKGDGTAAMPVEESLAEPAE